MKNRMLYPKTTLLLLLLMSLAMFGCKSVENEIQIGVILPMTGELASYGEPMKKGMEIAISKLNNDSITYNLIVEDSQANPSIAINSLQKLININKVQYVIGDVSSPVTLALVPIIERNNVFLLSPGASSPKLYNISKLFARNYPSSTNESIESAKFLINRKNIKSAAIIYVNSEYGIGLHDMFKETFESKGGEIAFSESYSFGMTNFRNIIAKLNRSNPKAIYLGGNQVEMGNFIRQLRESGSEALVVSNISFLEHDCLNIAQEAANGVFVPVAYYNPSDTIFTSAFNFSKYYKDKFNSEPTIPVAVGFDAVILISHAINKVGNDPKLVAEYIRNLKNYDGALGKLNFSNGDVTMPIEFKVVQDMRPVSYYITEK